MSYTDITPEAYDLALEAARGRYQRALLRGDEAWSGATLKGKAASYSSHYARSRSGLMARLYADSRLVVREVRGAHGKRIVEIELALHMRHDEGPVAPVCTIHSDCAGSSALALACGAAA